MADLVITELEAGIEADLERFAVPGAAWALIDGGRIVHEGGLGLVAADGGDPVTPATLFQACSISKPVAAFAMLRLVDRGLLDLDEDVNERLTSWRVPPTGGWQPIVTLRQLVSHSAGLTTSGFPATARATALPTTVEVLDGVAPANTSGCRVDTVPGSSSGTQAVGPWSCSSCSRTSPERRFGARPRARAGAARDGRQRLCAATARGASRPGRDSARRGGPADRGPAAQLPRARRGRALDDPG